MAKAKSENNSGDLLTAVPDSLGESGRALLGARLLQQLQTQLQNLNNQQVVNDLADDDVLPGVLVQGETVTVAGRREQLKRAIGNLVKSHEDIRDEFEHAVERVRQEVERQ